METTQETAAQLAQPHRKVVLTALLWVTITAGVFFAGLNFLFGSQALAFIELLMVGYSVFLLYIIRKTPHLERWILAYVLPFFTAMMFAMTAPRTTPSVFAWVLLVPILAHLLLGRRLGLGVAIFFIATAGIIFFYKHGDSPELMQPLPIANIIIIALSILAFSHVYEISREKSELGLFLMAQTDFLTGLANRARFNDIFERERRRAIREKHPLTVLVIDLDYFKEVNDQYGHEAGDKALVYVARLLQKRLRATDLACRLGGEEFGIILVDTPGRRAMQVAEELRSALETHPFEIGADSIAMTMSIGVAEFGPDGDELRAMLAAADHRLYQGKAEGRNRVIWHPAKQPELVTPTAPTADAS
ncbi:MAG: GGDEF domain-containing protein [Marinobacter sp.]|uniref:GGDEF domain-containing protein n=1 Tax=Marinobacter sp. TaxID=50741 RepID=UPI0034A00FFC